MQVSVDHEDEEEAEVQYMSLEHNRSQLLRSSLLSQSKDQDGCSYDGYEGEQEVCPGLNRQFILILIVVRVLGMWARFKSCI